MSSFNHITSTVKFSFTINSFCAGVQTFLNRRWWKSYETISLKTVTKSLEKLMLSIIKVTKKNVSYWRIIKEHHKKLELDYTWWFLMNSNVSALEYNVVRIFLSEVDLRIPSLQNCSWGSLFHGIDICKYKHIRQILGLIKHGAKVNQFQINNKLSIQRPL